MSAEPVARRARIGPHAIVLGAIALLSGVTFGPTLIALILALLAIVGPGVTVTYALFPQHRAAIRPAERALVGSTLGIAGLVIGGLFLDFLPGGVTARPWLGYLLLVMLGAVVVNLLRTRAQVGRRMTMPDPVRAVATLARSSPLGSVASVRDASLIGAGMSVALVALAIASFGTTLTPRSGFTQLWLIAEPTDAAQVQVGVQSMEAASVTYSLVLREGSTIIESWPGLMLRPGERWQQVVRVTTIGELQVDAILERADAPGVPYRRASIAIDPASSP